MRESIRGLTRQVTPEQLLADIQQVLQNSTAGLGFTPTLSVDGPPSLIPPRARPEVLAVLQEALSNVIRHATATAVNVTITSLGPEVRLIVTDNGRGIGELKRSSGLDNMRSRAQRLGGSCSITSNDPHGTIVDWRAPSITPDSPAAGSTVRQPSSASASPAAE